MKPRYEMLIRTHRSRDKTKEHVQELVHTPGGHEMICAGRSRSVDALSHVIFERKWRSLGDLDVVHDSECRAGGRERVALRLALGAYKLGGYCRAYHSWTIYP
jgi:hypothetical protein